MRHTIPMTLMAALVAIWPVAASAAAVTEDTFQLRSTSDLVALCSASPQDQMGTAALNFCQGFGVGAFRVLQEVNSARRIKMFCMPDPMPTRNVALNAFLAWAKANSDKLDQAPQDGIAIFLMSQYPCTSKK